MKLEASAGISPEFQRILIIFVGGLMLVQSHQYHSEMLIDVEYVQIEDGGSIGSNIAPEVQVSTIPFLQIEMPENSDEKDTGGENASGGTLFAVQKQPVIVEEREEPEELLPVQIKTPIQTVLQGQFAVSMVDAQGAIINNRYYILGEKLKEKSIIENRQEDVWFTGIKGVDIQLRVKGEDFIISSDPA